MILKNPISQFLRKLGGRHLDSPPFAKKKITLLGCVFSPGGGGGMRTFAIGSGYRVLLFASLYWVDEKVRIDGQTDIPLGKSEQQNQSCSPAYCYVPPQLFWVKILLNTL